MKTFARLIRRYVLATAGIILVVGALLLGMTIYAGVRYNDASDSVQKVGALAEALHPTTDGLQWDAAHTPAEWMQGCAWAMVLDEDGNQIELKEDEDALDTFNLARMDADDDRHRAFAEEAEFQESGFDIEDAPEDAGADIDVDFDDE